MVLLGCEAADRSEVASLRAAAERLPHEENWAESEVAGLLLRRWEAGDEIAPRYLPLFDENRDGYLSHRDELFSKYLEVSSGARRVAYDREGARDGKAAKPIRVYATRDFFLAKSPRKPPPSA